MFIVRGTSGTGLVEARSVSYACRTSAQALQKVLELLGKGLRDVMIVDPKGRRRTSAEFLGVHSAGSKGG
jgi:hypothetical protein